jgi:alkaline phosphatase
MKTTKRFAAMLAFAATAVTVWMPAAFAAPRGLVLVIADGLTPQAAELGSGYLKYQNTDDADATYALEDLRKAGRVQSAPGLELSQLSSLLKSAAANGYRTGLVTTDDVTKVAPLFFGLPAAAAGDTASTLVNKTSFDFIAGGGRAAFVNAGGADLGAVLKQAGGTPLFDADAAETDDENIKGKVLALQADASLSYAIDQDPEKEAGLGELATIAYDRLSADNAPFVLVIHDAQFARAIAAKDTPALVGEFDEMNSILGDLLGAREDNDDPNTLGIAVVAPGGKETARLTAATPDDKVNTFAVLSQMKQSFSGAASTLKGADGEKITDFATENYPGWKLTDETRSGIIAGTTDVEAALRASYEPMLKISYEMTLSTPTVYAIGIDPSTLAQTLQKLVAAKPAS